jgi:uncharacterized membrane protein YhaH (DUF805 family)
MSTDEDARVQQEAANIGRFLSCRSLISPGWYFAGIGGEIVILVLGVMAAAGLNNPTGGGDIFVAMIFPLIALWIHLCLVIGRLRDAGQHWFLGLLLAIAPYAWIAVTLEYIEYIGLIMAIVFIALYLLPALIPKKAKAEAQA